MGVSARDAEAYHKFPYLQLGTLALCRLAEPIALVSVLPYAYSMVKGFRFGDSAQAGLWSGFLISSFSICEAAVCPFWGALSDRVGRKPVLLIGLVGTMLSMLMFGFANSFWQALGARCIGGFLNGNIGVIQTIVGESTPNPAHQPSAFAVMPTVWLLGTIIGPSISAFSVGQIWPESPYLLPNLICVLILGLAIVIGATFLRETNPELVRQQDGPKIESAFPELARFEPIQSYGTFSRSSSCATLVEVHSELVSKLTDEPSVETNLITRVEAGEDDKDLTIYTRHIILLFGALALFSYHNMSFDHLLPILLVDPRSSSSGSALAAGGLGLTQQQVGMVLSLNGLLALTVQIFMMPALTHRVGVFRLFQLSVLVHPLAYILPPFIPALPMSPAWIMAVGLFADLALFNFASIILYPLLLILIKDAVPRPSVLGRVNGMAASCGALARAAAPPIVGWLHGVGKTKDIPGLAWYSTAAVACLACIQMMMLRREPAVSKGHGEIVSEEEAGI